MHHALTIFKLLVTATAVLGGQSFVENCDQYIIERVDGNQTIPCEVGTVPPTANDKSPILFVGQGASVNYDGFDDRPDNQYVFNNPYAAPGSIDVYASLDLTDEYIHFRFPKGRTCVPN
ncbi:hypothetical protein PTRG_10127 [Pyrenophora tritici-repentis Pt-1C-BFP]|uniref:Uncharacterized protein n=1 Tax=Pyrenophora tritici-repentis (strain Pt-1C-BFP) TaxID=426418 RepID=B2WJG8_PYRTR|nr:uncharacterized protein PTRG_10127 [Pyrenophora tritici-repentis Pt-1C-BFP]EDU43178.1 hypothetical protein PTRG_10127 [Pyrenophora tritici-repentis Pt-1C-BFP]